MTCIFFADANNVFITRRYVTVTDNMNFYGLNEKLLDLNEHVKRMYFFLNINALN